MSTPFICRQCIARLTQSRIVYLRPNRFQLHTQALPPSTPQPTWASFTQRGESSLDHDDTSSGLSQPPTSLSGPFGSQAPGLEPGRGREPRLRKYIPRRRLETAMRAHVHRPTTSRRLKLKVLKSRGNFMFIRDDVAYMYGITNYNARHAVNQLGRLLGGRDSGQEAGEELDRYHDWKKNLPELLQIVQKSQITPSDGEDSIQSNVKKDNAVQSWETVRGSWSELSNDRRKTIWQDYVVSLFRSTPAKVPSFVQETFQPERCPNYVIEDSIYLLLRSVEGARDGGRKRKQVANLIFFLLKEAPPKYLILDQWAIWKAISLIRTSRIFEFYEALRKLEHPLRQNTLLHLASRLAVRSRYKAQAIDIIRFLSTMPGFDINAPAPSSVCTTLFTMKKGDMVADDDAAPDELFKALLDLGFRPSLLGLSALMRNFCVRGRIDVAWKIFNSLLEAGIEPDAHVFSILLNGAKKAFDMESFQRDVDMIEATKGWTPVLLNDFLDYIYQIDETKEETRRDQRKRLGVRAWRLMVQLYTKFFHRAPFQKITDFPLDNLFQNINDTTPPHMHEISRMVTNLAQRPDDMLLQPDSLTLQIMLKAHYWSMTDPKALLIYYKKFMAAFAWREPIVTNLIEERGNAIHDILLKCLLQFERTFNFGIEMINRRVEYAWMEKKKHGKNTFHPPATVHTYTILMNGYRNHRQYEGVIRTLDSMVKAGITPTMATWNTVIGSLLETGAIERAVRVIEHINRIGLQPDKDTIEEVTCLTLGKRQAFAEFMAKIDKRPRRTNTRNFVKWLLRLWEKENGESKEAPISHKDAHQINKLYDQIGSENIRLNAGLREEDMFEDEEKLQLRDRSRDMDYIMPVKRAAKENKAISHRGKKVW
ncbi:hypothetical protein F5B19DRAFT_351077 [Rostrohypoxylon terebratum]|nr:hypothetical protein F5B19DRAFT_351077 [Rostrohypoxylon terebratum]